ncbi:MAG: Mrp/NBP35 family ATP-binding protein [Clostridia bacterium]
MSECNHDCSSCKSDCSERKEQQSMLIEVNKDSSIDKVIAVISGKGGVGKSLVTSLLACQSARDGLETAILDADITGPSIPKAFGVTEKAFGIEGMILPCVADNGVKMMSINLLLEDETQPVIWRGSLISNAVKQFWTDVRWENVNCMFVDMPPGTGDVPLTVLQSLPIAGIVIVTTPQDLVSMIVEKAIKMANMMNVSIVGIVENMSYYECPKCGERLEIFGKSKLDDVAKRNNITNIARIAINPNIATACDNGKIDTVKVEGLAEFFAKANSQIDSQESKKTIKK